VVAIACTNAGEVADHTTEFVVGMRVLRVNGVAVTDRGPLKTKQWVLDAIHNSVAAMASPMAELTVTTAVLKHMSDSPSLDPLMRSRSISSTRSWSPMTIRSAQSTSPVVRFASLRSHRIDKNAVGGSIPGGTNGGIDVSTAGSGEHDDTVPLRRAAGHEKDVTISHRPDAKLGLMIRESHEIHTPHPTQPGKMVGSGRLYVAVSKITPGELVDETREIEVGHRVVKINGATVEDFGPKATKKAALNQIKAVWMARPRQPLVLTVSLDEDNRERRQSSLDRAATANARMSLHRQASIEREQESLSTTMPSPIYQRVRARSRSTTSNPAGGAASTEPATDPDTDTATGTRRKSREGSGRTQQPLPAESADMFDEGDVNRGNRESNGKVTARNTMMRGDHYATVVKVARRESNASANSVRPKAVYIEDGSAPDAHDDDLLRDVDSEPDWEVIHSLGSSKVNPYADMSTIAHKQYKTVVATDLASSERVAPKSSRGARFSRGSRGSQGAIWGASCGAYADIGDGVDANAGDFDIPAILRSCMRWLGKRGRLSTRGIFREGGTEAHIQSLLHGFSTGGDPLNNNNELAEVLEHDVASAMKR
jgi:hypothetical protein